MIPSSFSTPAVAEIYERQEDSIFPLRQSLPPFYKTRPKHNHDSSLYLTHLIQAQHNQQTSIATMHRTITTALAFIGMAVLALALDYPFNALPLPAKTATFIGEMDRQAYELNGTVHVRLPAFCSLQ